MLIPITIKSLDEGFFSIINFNSAYFLDQDADEEDVRNSLNPGLWEIHSNGVLENQHSHEYLTVSGSNVITSKRLDRWIQVRHNSTDVEKYCLLNLADGRYLDITAGGIQTSLVCQNNDVTFHSFDLHTQSGNFQLRTYRDATTYLSNLANSDVTIGTTATTWTLTSYNDRTHQLKSGDTGFYLAEQTGQSNGFLANENFDDYEEWYLVRNVEDNNDVTYCLLNAKKRFYLGVDGNTGLATIPSRDCALDEKYELIAA